MAKSLALTSYRTRLTSYRVYYGTGERRTWHSYRLDTYSLDTALKRADAKRAEGYEVEIEKIETTTTVVTSVL